MNVGIYNTAVNSCDLSPNSPLVLVDAVLWMRVVVAVAADLLLAHLPHLQAHRMSNILAGIQCVLTIHTEARNKC